VGLQRPNLNVRLVVGAALVAAAGLASGCMSAPTYGTDKTATAQLGSDLTNILSLEAKRKPVVDYAPRPDLVKPAKGGTTLPAPQESVATAGNPNWPESPEQRLARIRAEADANADNPNYDSPVVSDMALSQKPKPIVNQHVEDSGIRTPQQVAYEEAEYKRRLKENQLGNSTSRKYLSEPPLDYRQANAAAPTGETGEDEDDKERRLKREARKKNGGFDWSDLNPF
jgi:hypothetical protein